MADEAGPSTGAKGTVTGLAIFAALLGAICVAILNDLGRSDAAGNAIGEAYAAIGLCLLCLVVGVMAIVTAAAGVAPRWAKMMFLILVIGSGVAAFVTLGLVSRPGITPYRWPVFVPALSIPLIIAFCLGTMLLPSGGVAVLRAFPAATLGLLLVVLLSMWPMISARNAFAEREEKARIKYEADLARLPPDAPLWDWVPFLDTRNEVTKADLLDKIARLPRKQSEVETMLDRGDFPLGYLGRMELRPTLAICEKARVLLRKQVAPLVLPPGTSKPFSTIFWPVDDALASMRWLARNNCDISAEAGVWEAMASAYSDYNYDVYELRDLKLKKAP